MGLQNNIFLAGSPSFLELLIKHRFQQEDWAVYGPCDTGEETKACFKINNIQNIMFFADDEIKSGNICGLPAALEIAKEYQVKRFFFISSMQVFSEAEMPVSEISEPHPDSEIGKNYLLAENLLQSYCSIYEMKYCLIRKSNVYGPGEVPALGNVSQWILDNNFTENAPKVMGSNEYLFVDDFVFAIYQTVSREHDFSLLHLTGGESKNSSALGQNELGWSFRYTWNRGWQKTTEWVKEYCKQSTSKSMQSKRTWKKSKT